MPDNPVNAVGRFIKVWTAGRHFRDQPYRIQMGELDLSTLLTFAREHVTVLDTIRSYAGVIRLHEIELTAELINATEMWYNTFVKIREAGMIPVQPERLRQFYNPSIDYEEWIKLTLEGT